jgi:hypothetical protein
MAKRRTLTVYQRIRRAALDDAGCQLTPTECYELYYRDDAFRTRADLDEDGWTAEAERAARRRGETLP